jgi:hypothetical protein
MTPANGGEDYDDPEVAARWLTDQRARVEEYLAGERVRHGAVGDTPAWFVAPYVSVWTVGSVKSPGKVGWWAISGDLPTDYLSGGDAVDARRAVAAFAARWRNAAEYMLRDQDPPDLTIGRPQNRQELGRLLLSRANLLTEFASDDGIW